MTRSVPAAVALRFQLTILSGIGEEAFIMSARHSTRKFNVVPKYAMRESSRPSRWMRTTVLAMPFVLDKPTPSKPSFPAASASFFSNVGPCRTVWQRRTRTS